MRHILFIIFFLSHFTYSQEDAKICMQFYENKKYDEAYVCFKDSATTVLDYYMCAMLARHFKESGEFDQWNEASLKEFQNDPLAYYYVSYLIDPTSKKHMKVIKKGLKKFPKDSTLLASQINAYIELDDKKSALKIADKLTELYPEVLKYQVTRGTILQNMDRNDEAITCFQKCLKNNPQNEIANYGLGSIYYNRAADKFTEANATEDNAIYSKLNQEALDFLELAKPFLERTYLNDPKNENNFVSLKTCYMRLGMMKQYRDLMDDRAKLIKD